MVASGVTFAIPTLNEEPRLARCLSSIRAQAYPQHLVEIIVADGGSSDKTVALAEQFGARVVRNERKLAEPGVALAMSLASHDYCVAFAADNVLPHPGWLRAMVRPLDDDLTVGAAFTHIANATDDNSFSQYFNVLHADPFNAFVYADAANPQRFHRLYRIERTCPEYTIFHFDIRTFPLLALAQGFMVRRSLLDARESALDDILPIMGLIEAGVPMAYVPSAGVYHYSLAGFGDFIRKYNRRIANAMAHGFAQRVGYLSATRRLRQYLWLIYALTVIGPTVDAIRWIRATRRLYYLYHPPANFTLALLIVKHMLQARFRPARERVVQPSPHSSPTAGAGTARSR